MLRGPPRRRPARPVADAPIESLLARSEDLAKGWLLALLENAPLGDAPRIMAADLSRDGPRICDAIVRAIADDRDLDRLAEGGALAPLAARAGELAAAGGAGATAHAVDALHGVIWSALRSELRDPDPDLIASCAERLAQVTDLVRVAALRRADVAARTPDDDSLRAVDLRAVRHADASDPRDEQPPPPVAGRAAARAWPDEARSEPQALWVGALADEIRAGAGTPLSLLLAELEDADRLIAVEGPTASAATFGEFARAVRAALRRRDILVCETDSRLWVIARDTGRPGVQALGARISEAVRGGPQWRGAPMVASIGVAVLGEDGRTPSQLIEAAEEARFAAAAGGVDMTYTGADEGPEDL